MIHGEAPFLEGQPVGRLRPLILNENFAQIRNEKLGIRNEGGGFAANIYGRCPKVAFKSLVTSRCFLI